MSAARALVLAALACAGCTELQAFTCDVGHTCPADADCVDGRCVARGGGDAPPAGACDFDGTVDDGEECDDGDHDADDVCVDCRWAACGDGHVRADAEDCDPPGAACTAACVACDGQVEGLSGTCWSIAGAGTRAEGNAECEQMKGGHLGTATTSAEIEGPLATTFAAAAAPAAYLGLDDGDVEGDFFFGNGETIVTIPWAPGQPDGGVGSPYVVVTATGWDDVPGSTIAPALCERDPPYVRPTDHHAYPLDLRGRTWDSFIAGGCGFGGRPAIFADLDELSDVVASRPPRAGCAWVGGTYEPGSPLAWIEAGGAMALPFASGAPTDQPGCLCVDEDGLDIRPCGQTRDSLCEIE